uniref:Uncharacterized protein n=1 Tax=Xenopus tropicalis TaxID=8364 RepID=A0A803J3K5_XENTR
MLDLLCVSARVIQGLHTACVLQVITTQSCCSCYLPTLIILPFQFTTGSCSEEIYSCEICCHNQVKRHLCTFCGKGNDVFFLFCVFYFLGIRLTNVRSATRHYSEVSLESHLKQIHGVQQGYAYKQRRDKLFVCEDCGYTGPSQEDLYLHKTTKKLAAILQTKIKSVLQIKSTAQEEVEAE